MRYVLVLLVGLCVGCRPSIDFRQPVTIQSVQRLSKGYRYTVFTHQKKFRHIYSNELFSVEDALYLTPTPSLRKTNEN